MCAQNKAPINYEKAAQQYKVLLHANPHNNQIRYQYAYCLYQLEQHEQAAPLYEQLIPIFKNTDYFWYQFGTILEQLEQIPAAITAFENAIAINNHPAIYTSLSFCYLKLGNLEKARSVQALQRKILQQEQTEQVWSPDSVQKKTILIHDEAGFGDFFHWIRYAQLLHEKGARIIVSARPALIPILSLCPYIELVIANTDSTNIHNYDHEIAVGSLCTLFNTTIETAPHNTPYLYASENLIDKWKHYFKDNSAFKIGLCWHAQSYFNPATGKTTGAERNIDPRLFQALSNLPNVQLYSLQKINGCMGLPQVKDFIHFFPHDFDESEGRFMDTAAIMTQLDLIITVDTSIEHLAGALSRPVWILLSKPSDWRWFLNKTDSIWYPTVKLFKQRIKGDWTSVMHAITQELTDLLP